MLKTLSTLGFLVMVAGLIGLFATGNLFSPSPLAIAPQAAAVLLMIWARLTFGLRSFHATANATAGGLVTTGPYRVIRHPIYCSVCLFAAGGIAANASWTGAGIGVLVLVGAIARLRCEEVFLTRQYPEYRDYAGRTWRLVPFVF